MTGQEKMYKRSRTGRRRDGFIKGIRKRNRERGR